MRPTTTPLALVPTVCHLLSVNLRMLQQPISVDSTMRTKSGKCAHAEETRSSSSSKRSSSVSARMSTRGPSTPSATHMRLNASTASMSNGSQKRKRATIHWPMCFVIRSHEFRKEAMAT